MSTLSAESRNASVDARNALINGGKLRLRQGSTTICDIPLASTAYEAAGTNAPGEARMIGDDNTNPVSGSNPRTGTAVADATTGIDNFQFLTSGDAVRRSGSVGAGQEIELAAYVVGAGTTIRVTNATHGQPAS